MKVLGIDAGSEKSGWVVFDTETFKVVHKGISPNKELTQLLGGGYDVAALEMIASYGMPVGKTTFDTCLWIGRFCQKIEDNGKKTNLLYKKIDINPTICGSNKAKDSNIRQAILDMFPANGGGKTPQIGVKNNQGDLFGVSSHMWSALAVALTYSLQNNLIERRYGK